MQETRVRSLGQDHPLEKGMAAHSSILAWRIPWTEEPGGVQSRGRTESGTTERLTLLLFSFFQCVYVSPDCRLPPGNCACLFSTSVTLFMFCQ